MTEFGAESSSKQRSVFDRELASNTCETKLTKIQDQFQNRYLAELCATVAKEMLTN